MDSQVKNFIQQLDEAKKSTDDDHWAFVYDSDIGRKREIFLRKKDKKMVKE